MDVNENEPEENEQEEEFLKSSDIAITKLDTKTLKKDLKECTDFGKAVYEVLKNRFEKSSTSKFNDLITLSNHFYQT